MTETREAELCKDEFCAAREQVLWDMIIAKNQELAALSERIAMLLRDSAPKPMVESCPKCEKRSRQDDQVVVERDEAEEALSQAYFLITGRSPEWSNHFGKKECLEEIDEAQRLLRQAAKSPAPLTVEAYEAERKRLVDLFVRAKECEQSSDARSFSTSSDLAKQIAALDSRWQAQQEKPKPASDEDAEKCLHCGEPMEGKRMAWDKGCVHVDCWGVLIADQALARGRALEREDLLSDERVEKFIYDHLCKQKRSFGPEDVAYLRDFVKQLEAKP